MITTKNIKFSTFLKMTGPYVLILFGIFTIITLLYYFEIIHVAIPWLPISIIATAVAFYVGFKNNQSYDRMWEARKIWGGIVNESRSLGMMIDGYISNDFVQTPFDTNELQKIKQRLMYRHIAWLYAHRSQLLIPTSWEHVSQGGKEARYAKEFQEKYGVGLVADEVTQNGLHHFLPPEEHDRLINHVNTATQIINEQSRDLSQLRARGMLDDFRHMQMMDVLRSFYTLQGKNERIKKFPLPRQYANISRYFVGIFIFLLPFGLIPELMKIEDYGIWLAIPITVLVGWVYVMMEVVGDYSENPFSGMAQDIPMMSLCRIIEIDLREMLGETDLPSPIQSVDGVLM
ncbi:bestrophin family protein [Membranihabitans marinus]|uniref:bestrophin family protein n=1 Tax=Membranihabitans marinus TaxID=1227546 RepID=UPI001F2C2D73|nr:bestrophin family ion channel [Membranihabitans marinus]